MENPKVGVTVQDVNGGRELNVSVFNRDGVLVHETQLPRGAKPLDVSMVLQSHSEQADPYNSGLSAVLHEASDAVPDLNSDE